MLNQEHFSWKNGTVKLNPKAEAAGFRVIYAGECLQEKACVIEGHDNIGSTISLITQREIINLRKYNYSELKEAIQTPATLYLGYSEKEVLDNGRDILGELVLSKGEPTFEKVQGILPPIRNKGYSFIGGAASWGSVVIDQKGNLYSQMHGGTNITNPLFSPTQIDHILGSIEPFQCLIDGYLPISINLHQGKDLALELIHFVEPGDTDRDPIVWSRASIRNHINDELIQELYFISSYARPSHTRHIDAGLFWDVFASCIKYWQMYTEKMASFELPEESLIRSLKGIMVSLGTTFSGDHPHYGHQFYGRETHDNFPPTTITAVETLCLLGKCDQARRICEHMLAFAFDASGRYVYRQGLEEDYGAAGTEYGQWLWIIERYALSMKANQWLSSYVDVLRSIGDHICINIQPCPEMPDVSLLHLCAEADTNGRINDYIQNNLWAVRGLYALNSLLITFDEPSKKYADVAKKLLSDTEKAISRMSIPTRFGNLPPFQIQYPNPPETLSNCRDTYSSLNDEQYNRYMQVSDMRCTDYGTQDYLENTYANYRYYLEMLSSRYLDRDKEIAIEQLRENLGGELLGMTRLFDRVDDWPVFNYARYLLETGKKDKYLLLLYAHTQYHGIPELNVYYEQFAIDGRVIAPDCVPSLLITPMMLSWMFSFEPVEGESLQLLAGVPTSWFLGKHNFHAKGLWCRYGEVSISVAFYDEKCRIELSLPKIPKKCAIKLHIPYKANAIHFTNGTEHITSIVDNCVSLSHVNDVSLEFSTCTKH